MAESSYRILWAEVEAATQEVARLLVELGAAQDPSLLVGPSKVAGAWGKVWQEWSEFCVGLEEWRKKLESALALRLGYKPCIPQEILSHYPLGETGVRVVRTPEESENEERV